MVGIVLGCFIPLHEGHKVLIHRALTECDEVLIVVCGYDDDRGKDFIPYKDRIKLMKQIYNHKDYPNVTVTSVDDKKIGLTGKFDLESWKLWCEEMWIQSGWQPNGDEYTWYLGEQSYVDHISKLYPKHHFYLADRTCIPISGTIIRENPRIYDNMIDPIFYLYLSSKT